ncbi:MAG: Fe-S protein assembly co-chaperone HscB, partial [Phycisphaerae bacterium]|nr:Fe-S protein assembly co-chaperone HscB [Phycisphaerae bacterium]
FADMDKHSDHALPAKCKHCEKPMSTPLVCDYCHALNPAAASAADHFTLFGLPQQYDIDERELQHKYLALNRHAHPDFHAGDSAEVQELHLRISATINNAYRTLKDPAGRADYLLELLGGKTSAADKSVPEGFLQTMMMMQEELADAKSSDDLAELERIGRVLQTQHDGLMHRVAGLFAEFHEAVACEAVRIGLLDEIRKQLNAVSYVKKLLSQV